MRKRHIIYFLAAIFLGLQLPPVSLAETSTVVIPLGGDDHYMYWQGEWAANIPYKVGDGVSYDGSSYLCVNAHTSDETSYPPDALYWEILAAGGSDGPAGPVAGTDKQVVYNDNGIAAGAGILYDKITGNVGVSGSLTAVTLSGAHTGDGSGLTDVDAETVDGMHAADLSKLTEPEVEAYIENGPVDLHAATTIGGEEISTGPHTGGMLSFVGQIIMVPWSFCPVDWTEADGKLLNVIDYPELFSLVGSTYGGDGRTTFAVPDLRGRMGIGVGQGDGLLNHLLGQNGGEESVAVSINEMPQHNHSFNANDSSGAVEDPTDAFLAATGVNDPEYQTTSNVVLADGAVGLAGNGLPHENMPPYLVMRFCVSLAGAYPMRP